jgi:hypothetical protein
MNKRTVFFIGLAVVLAAVYAFAFTDWFKPRFIQILYRQTPDGKITYLLAGGPYALTSVRVFAAEDLANEAYPPAMWDLIADQQSKPVKEFHYGGKIRGMKPRIPLAQPQPLEPQKTYRIIIQAGKVKAEKEFTTR